MAYIRFTPDDYDALRRICSPHLTHALHPRSFKRLLLSRLSTTRPALAERIAELSSRRLSILFDHFSRRHSAGAGGERHTFSGEELRVLADACEPFLAPVRFVRYLRMALADRLRDLFPDLARKVAGLSDEQFGRLYAQVTGQAGGST